jgi:holo-[acyl-carrier protein] synthase
MDDSDRLSLESLDVRRVARLIDRFPRLRTRLFTEMESQYCDLNRRKPHQHYAARLAAKFAVRRLLGGGALREIEVVRDSSGSPSIRLHGRADRIAEGRDILISLSHEGALALAYVFVSERHV